MAVNITLKAYQDGVEKLSVVVAEGDAHHILTGLPQLLGTRITDPNDWGFDNWKNGDMVTNLFTDAFPGAIVATLGAGWTQSNIGGLSTPFRVNGNACKPPAKSAVSNGIPLEIATPVTATAIENQHCEIEYTSVVVTTGNGGNPLVLCLRGNGTAISGWNGYTMRRIVHALIDDSEVGDGPFHEQYEIDISYFDANSNTYTVLGTTGVLTGNNVDDDGTSKPVMRFTAENIAEASYPPDTTVWTLPFDVPAGMCVVTLEDSGELNAGDEIPGAFRTGEDPDNDSFLSSVQIGVPGDYSGVAVAFGLRYDTDVQLSKLYVREQGQDGGVASETDAITQVQRLKVKYAKTGGFEVTVLPTGRASAYVSSVDADDNVSEGTLEVPVLNNNEQVTIHVKNNSCHRPFSITGMAWDSIVSQKTKR